MSHAIAGARVLALFAAFGVAPRAVVAQTAIAGVVRDSVTGRPLAGAVVQLVSARVGDTTARSADADPAGRFRLAPVPPGRYLVGFLHPRVDALGLDLPPRAVEIVATDSVRDIDLAIPSARTIAAAACGAQGDSTGALLGRVLEADRRAPAPGGEVTARWTELVDTRGLVRQAERSRRARADDEGHFALCGLPAPGPVRVQAASRAARSGVVELRLSPGTMVERDLLVSDDADSAGPTDGRRGTARVEGKVYREDGRTPAARAMVMVRGSGAADTFTVAGANGAFAIAGLPAGTYSLEARAIGFHPERAPVDLESGRTTTADVTFSERVTTLEPIRVYATARRDPTGFDERSRGPFGRFITTRDIERLHMLTVPDLLRTVPGIQVFPNRGTSGWAILSPGYRSFNVRCTPAVFLDGALLIDGDTSLDRYVQPAEVAGIEVYLDLASVPRQFQHGICGSVVVWTKRGWR